MASFSVLLFQDIRPGRYRCWLVIPLLDDAAALADANNDVTHAHGLLWQPGHSTEAFTELGIRNGGTWGDINRTCLEAIFYAVPCFGEVAQSRMREVFTLPTDFNAPGYSAHCRHIHERWWNLSKLHWVTFQMPASVLANSEFRHELVFQIIEPFQGTATGTLFYNVSRCY